MRVSLKIGYDVFKKFMEETESQKHQDQNTMKEFAKKLEVVANRNKAKSIMVVRKVLKKKIFLREVL